MTQIYGYIRTSRRLQEGLVRGSPPTSIPYLKSPCHFHQCVNCESRSSRIIPAVVTEAGKIAVAQDISPYQQHSFLSTLDGVAPSLDSDARAYVSPGVGIECIITNYI